MEETNNLNEIREEILLSVKEYYQSIKKLYEYRLKNLWKYNLLMTPFVISVFFLVFNVIPALNNVTNFWLTKLIGDKFFGIAIVNEKGWISWLFAVGTSLIIFLILSFVNNLIKEARDRKSLPDNKMPFCLIQSAIDDLKNYLLNNLEPHLESAVRKIERYFDLSEAKYNIKVKDKNDDILIFDLISNIQAVRFWFNVTDETQVILDSQKELKIKLIERVYGEEEIDEVINVLQCLSIYEYSKIKRAKEEALKSTKKNVKEIGKLFLFESAKLINKMKRLPVISEADDKKVSLPYIIKFYKWSYSLFISSNILVLFTSWLILSSGIIISLCVEATNYWNIKVDSTIMIGVITTPLAIASGITATLYQRQKKK